MNENMSNEELKQRGWVRSEEDQSHRGLVQDKRDFIWKSPCSLTACPQTSFCVHRRYMPGEAHNGSDPAVQVAELEQIHGRPYQELNFAPAQPRS